MGHRFECAGGKAVGVLIRRHICVAITFEAILEEPLIDACENIDSVALQAILLWQNAIDDRAHGLLFIGSEKSDRYRPSDPTLYQHARRSVPVFLLCQRAEARIVAGLFSLGKICPCCRVLQRRERCGFFV